VPRALGADDERDCGQIHDVLSGSSYTILPGFGHDGVNRAPEKLITELSEFFAG
jgi:hypothetical protein